MDGMLLQKKNIFNHLYQPKRIIKCTFLMDVFFSQTHKTARSHIKSIDVTMQNITKFS